MTLPDWQLIGSGPSAARWPRSPRAKAACVNGSAALVDEPDAYGIFELQAAQHYRGEITRARKRSTRLFMRPRAITRSGQEPHRDKIIIIDNSFGPPELRDLHNDVQWKAEDPEVPEHGQSVAWITSGVLMLWAIAELERPEKIFISGLDLYPTHTKEQDYAPTLTKIHKLDDQVEWQERRRQLNKRAAEGIERISLHYGDTDFIYLEEPNCPIQALGRCRIAEAEDLRRLYMGPE